MKQILFTRLTPVVAVVALLCVGCASTPDYRYYTLDMKSSGEAEVPFNIVVDRFEYSDALARQEIMIQKTPTQIEYYAEDQWVANIGALVREKLQTEFGTETRPDAQTLYLAGEILSFGQVDTVGRAEAHIKLELVVSIGSAGRSALAIFRKTYESRVSAKTARPPEIVAALSAGLEGIAVQIVADLRKLPVD